MASNNSYLLKHVKLSGSLEAAVLSINSKVKKNVKLTKPFLSIARELCLHLSITQSGLLNEEHLLQMLEALKDFGDSDIDRKFFRIYMFVITEILFRQNFKLPKKRRNRLR